MPRCRLGSDDFVARWRPMGHTAARSVARCRMGKADALDVSPGRSEVARGQVGLEGSAADDAAPPPQRIDDSGVLDGRAACCGLYPWRRPDEASSWPMSYLSTSLAEKERGLINSYTEEDKRYRIT